MKAQSFNFANKAMKKVIGIVDDVTWKSRTHLVNVLGNNTNINDAQLSTLMDMLGAYKSIVEQLAINPSRTFSKETDLLKNHVSLLRSSLMELIGLKGDTVIEEEKGDRRFKDKSWNDNPFFSYLKQAYLLNSKTVLDLVNTLEDTNNHTHDQFMFFTRQLVNALAPTNFVLTNPAVLRKTAESGGGNLVDGFKNFIEDYRRNPNLLNIAMTDFAEFEVGKNLATTPGKVVFQNRMFQLIQYSPTTEQVNQTPLLVIPPWINKYYILDLKEENSLVKWLVDQGHSVFIVSWVNPGPSLRDVRFDDYLLEGFLPAMQAVTDATGEHSINVIGYCVGGTLLSCALAYLEDKGLSDRVKCATYLTTLIDFTDPGGIGVFIRDSTIEGIERSLEKHGYYDGRAMAFSFNLLRENDLFWSFFVNNYLMGEKPDAFDLLFWNSDGTNLPAAMHAWYLRNLYLENKLVQPNGVKVADTDIDHRTIKTPVYFLSTIQDHIAKWKTTYKGTQIHGGDVTFVLSGSGHIAGVVNPPKAEKYCHWVNGELPEDPEQWLESAEKHHGSWWSNWNEWVQPHVGEKVDARNPGEMGLEAIEDAPGTYVKQRIADVIND